MGIFIDKLKIVESLTGGKVEMIDLGLSLSNDSVKWLNNEKTEMYGGEQPNFPANERNVELKQEDLKVGLEVRNTFSGDGKNIYHNRY